MLCSAPAEHEIDRVPRNPAKLSLIAEGALAELAKLPTNRVPERADWARLSSAWTTRVDEQIAELQRLRAGVTQCIGCGCLSLQQCHLSNPGDRVGRTGPGPRFWIGETAPASRRTR